MKKDRKHFTSGVAIKFMRWLKRKNKGTSVRALQIITTALLLKPITICPHHLHCAFWRISEEGYLTVLDLTSVLCSRDVEYFSEEEKTQMQIRLLDGLNIMATFGHMAIETLLVFEGFEAGLVPARLRDLFKKNLPSHTLTDDAIERIQNLWKLNTDLKHRKKDTTWKEKLDTNKIFDGWKAINQIMRCWHLEQKSMNTNSFPG